MREIGCSNFSTALLEEAAAAVGDGDPGFVSVQNQYNILYRDPEEPDGVLAECDRTGMAFLPYFPLALGLLSGKFRPGQPVPEGTRLKNMGDAAASQLTEERLATVAALDDLARAEGHTVLDLAFGWLLSHPAVASVIAGASNPEQIQGNVRAGAWQPSAEVLARVDAIAPRSSGAGASARRAVRTRASASPPPRRSGCPAAEWPAVRRPPAPATPRTGRASASGSCRSRTAGSR